ncbi:MAG: Nramp family divalent metal transporter [Planctomycetaceae bacterium]|nr:Nramp family divalent metal transporter [Planctomycetaceae bacterium]
MSVHSRPNLLAIIGPGLIVAATGVGAGDLATGAFTGSKLGVAVLWAVILGATLKYAVNEGLARWQLMTGTTLLEGVARHLGRWAIGLFLAYLVIWTFFVASALMNASGVAMNAVLPLGDSPELAARGKIIYGIGHSALALALIRIGGYKWFERIMSACVGLMFTVVVGAAIAIGPDWPAVLRGLVWPTIPAAGGEGVSWTVALMGGIGGTVTVLGYGYWIREEGRSGASEIPICRIDLAVGYAMTALFGLGMVIIGSELLDLHGDPNKGTTFVLGLAKQLEQRLGAIGPLVRWSFIAGAWAAIFSSVLGVWQSVPFLFADSWRLLRGAGDRPGEMPAKTIDEYSRPYVIYQLALATLPAVSLVFNFVELQKLYAIVGALFIPVLAVVLLVLNRRPELGPHRNSWRSMLVLCGALAFFAAAAAMEIRAQLAPDTPQWK